MIHMKLKLDDTNTLNNMSKWQLSFKQQVMTNHMLNIKVCEQTDV